MPRYLTITKTDNPGCPAGSATTRVDLAQPPADGTWPGMATIADDGRALWAPPASVPSEVANVQIRLALMALKTKSLILTRTLFDDVNIALQAAGGANWQLWENANAFKRNSALTTAIGVAGALTAAQLDALYVSAATMASG